MNNFPIPPPDGSRAVLSDLSTTAREAFVTLRDEIEAVSDRELVSITIALPLAARRGLVAAERIAPLLPTLSRLPWFDVHRVAKLRLYSLALLHAHAETVSGPGEGTSLAPRLEEADALRNRMLRTADVLVRYGVVPPERLAALRGGRGHASRLDSLHGLSLLFEDLWPRVQGHVMVTREMIARAATLSTELLQALGEREARKNPLAVRRGPRHRRWQAFSLFSRSYEEARRGATFLRWYERDAQEIVPSLHGRPRPSKRAPFSDSETAMGSDRVEADDSPANDPGTPAIPA